MTDYSLGCRLPVEDWIWLNRVGIFDNPVLCKYAAPFPPTSLMHNVSGLDSEKDFASHGADIFLALSRASQKPLSAYEATLDFGCGVGRLARMFKGSPHKVCGCDIDPRHIAWTKANLDYMQSELTYVNTPLPYVDNEFDAIISISVFTHLNEESQFKFLAELHRICRPEGRLFLTVHGSRALERAVQEQTIRDMISVADTPFQEARRAFAMGDYAFILQNGHLTNIPRSFTLRGLFRRKIIMESFEYGITFLPESYLREHWLRWFDIVEYLPGAIHSFQDIVVLSPKK